MTHPLKPKKLHLNLWGVSMSKNYSSVRSRSWSLVLYEDPINVFPTLSVFCSHYVYIYHDKDLTSQGTPKEPHYHLLLLFQNAKTLSAIKSYFTGVQNILGEPIHDKYKAFRYLLHLDNPESFQYPSDSLISDDISYWTSLDPDCVSTSDGEKTLEMLDDILACKPLRYMVSVYGRDFVKNYLTYRDFAHKLSASDRASAVSPTPVTDPLELALFHKAFE